MLESMHPLLQASLLLVSVFISSGMGFVQTITHAFLWKCEFYVILNATTCIVHFRKKQKQNISSSVSAPALISILIF